jgi:hypothetical protein
MAYPIFFKILLFISLFSLLVVGCGGNSLKSPTSLLKTFCFAYNSSDDNLLKGCGVVDYVLKQIAVEKLDQDGNPYFIKANGLNFEIENIQKGRIGIQKEYSDQKILVNVRFFSDSDSKYIRRVTIYLVLKKSSANSDSKWQIYPLPT